MYQLQPDESLGEGLRRVAREQVDAALASLRRGADRNEAIHEARKSTKKLRAALRLVRGELGERLYREQNTAYRDAAGLLSAARDRWVLVETVDALSERYGALLAAGALDSVRRLLVERHRVALERMLEVEQADVRAVTVLEQAWSAIAGLPMVFEPEAEVVATGVRRVYREGRRALARCAKQPTTPNFHEWRKQVKYLWYHSRLLGARAGEGVATLAERLGRLSRQLGEEHDLAMLGAELRGDRQSTRSLEHLQVLLGLVEQRRGELREAALALGRRLYARKPAEVAARLERHWQGLAPAVEGSGSRTVHAADAPATAPAGPAGGSVTRFDPARRRTT